MLGLPLAFVAPWVLVALAGLPVLYYLLRVTPPPPKRVPLPTLPIVKDLMATERLPSRTPWWLLALRLLLVALAVLAMAGPRWNPPANDLAEGKGPLVLLIDNGWAAAPDWRERVTRTVGLIDPSSTRPIAVRTSADEPQEIIPTAASAAIDRLRAVQPVAYTPDRKRQFGVIEAFARANAGTDVVWVTDNTQVGEVKSGEADPAVAAFTAALGPALRVISRQEAGVRAIVGAVNQSDAMVVRLRRSTVASDTNVGLVRALDGRGRQVGEAAFDFAGGTEANAAITAPIEARNDIVRVEIADGRSAGGVLLLDAGSQRRKVALVSGETADTAQPLVSGAYFVAKALTPYASLTEMPRGGEAIGRAIESRPEIIVLVDVGTLSKPDAETLTGFVRDGGILVRFAGSGLASSADTLLPVRLRRGGRVLGGALSWEKPQRLAQFSDAGPFAGLPVPADVAIERQVLAEPDPDLGERTWAALTDGTPLVTAARIGKGQVVLFHVTADTSWSNLPLAGVFVDMLRKILPLAVATGERAEKANETANPRRMLDGFGMFVSPPPTAKPIQRTRTGPGTADNPPGFYGPPEATIAVNTLETDVSLQPLALSGVNIMPLNVKPPVDLRPWMMAGAALLLLLDGLAILWLSGILSRRRAAIATVAAGLMLGVGVPGEGLAQQPPAVTAPPKVAATAPRKEDVEASLAARLAYVITGNATVDETSKLGLASLSKAMGNRTSFEPAAPMGLDPGRDELVFYSLIYWPITADQPMPTDAALKAIDQFMKNGGTVIFDTRDASALRSPGTPPAETRRLRQMLASLDIPDLEQVPKDHVLTKTFYLLDRVVGRYAQGETWIETMPRGNAPATEKRPARAGDRVSPLVITSNDLAAAWAVDRAGQPMFPMVPGEPRQREMALRAGINLVMYAMTGNYKADQVHVPALLERLGQ